MHHTCIQHASHLHLHNLHKTTCKAHMHTCVHTHRSCTRTHANKQTCTCTHMCACMHNKRTLARILECIFKTYGVCVYCMRVLYACIVCVYCMRVLYACIVSSMRVFKTYKWPTNMNAQTYLRAHIQRSSHKGENIHSYTRTRRQTHAYRDIQAPL